MHSVFDNRIISIDRDLKREMTNEILTTSNVIAFLKNRSHLLSFISDLAWLL